MLFEYDSNYNFLKTDSNSTFTTHQDAKYIKVKYNKSGETETIPVKLNNNVSIYEINVSTDYNKLPFIPNYEVKNIGKDTVDNYSIKDRGINLNKLDFINYDNTINKVNFYRFVPYSNLETQSGLYAVRDDYLNTCSNPNYIPVDSETSYSFSCKSPYSYTVNWYWYDNNKNYISYTTGVTSISPATASYLRIKLGSTGHGADVANGASHIIISKTTSPIDFKPAYTLSSDIIPSDSDDEKIKDIIDNKREKFIKLNKTKKLLNFAMCTDTHLYDETGDQTGLLDIKVVNEIGKENWIDFAVHGGDIFNAYLEGSVTGSQGITHEVAMQRIDDALKGFKDIKVPIYIARGNHDINNKYKPGYPDDTTIDTTQNVTKPEFYMLAQHNFAKNIDGRLDLNFYKDYTDLKIRVIVLDVYSDMTESPKFTHDTLDWLANTALKVDINWSCMIICHTIEGRAGQTLQDLIGAYKTGGTYTDSTLHVTADYTAQGSRTFIGCICGHTHSEGESNTLGFWNITSSTSYLRNDANIANNIYASVFTVDPDNHLLYKQKVGANGYNKIYDYVNLTVTNISE